MQPPPVAPLVTAKPRPCSHAIVNSHYRVSYAIG